MRIILTAFCCVLFIFPTVADAKIVFYSRGDETSGIYVMNDNGTNLTLLTDKLAHSYPHHPRWSPDGTQIIFRMRVSRSSDREWRIFVMNADGTNVRPLHKHHTGTEGEPSVSPDGKRVLFTTSTFKKHYTNILDLESGEIIELPDIVAISSDWSPDSRHIVFASRSFAFVGDAGGDIWIMDANGENVRKLLPTPVVGEKLLDRSSPRWSPDGKQILYVESEHVFRKGILTDWLVPKDNRYLICDLNGENLLKLHISKKWKHRDIDWMDNGEAVLLTASEIKLNKILFGQTRHTNMYKYNIATSKITRLTDHPGWDYEVDWTSGYTLPVSPKGKMPTQWGQIKKGAPTPK